LCSCDHSIAPFIGIETEHRLGRQHHHLRLPIHVDQQRRGVRIGELQRLPNHRAVALAEGDHTVAHAAGLENQHVLVRERVGGVSVLKL
jgi:hypothetical protein